MANKIISLWILTAILFFSASVKAVVQSKPFGQTPDGNQVTLYELVNSNGLRATVMDYGAILVNLEVPDSDGKLADINLGFDELEPYIKRSPMFGAVVGRYANRIENARYQPRLRQA